MQTHCGSVFEPDLIEPDSEIWKKTLETCFEHAFLERQLATLCMVGHAKLMEKEKRTRERTGRKREQEKT